MAAMRVYQLAKELKITSKDLLTHLRAQGVELPSHMSALTDEQVAQLTREFSAPPAGSKAAVAAQPPSAAAPAPSAVAAAAPPAVVAPVARRPPQAPAPRHEP